MMPQHNQLWAIDPNRLWFQFTHSSGAWVNRPCLWAVAIGCCLFFAGCQTAPKHDFAQPATDWQTKMGQLQYRGTRTTLIGEVMVRYSRRGDFELTFSKGPGATLLMVRQDATFAEVEGPLARGRWAGTMGSAPERLRGWLQLRDVVVRSQKRTLQHSAGGETFVFSF